jgi:5-formyltetrahydrofolate cyclo-ligase
MAYACQQVDSIPDNPWDVPMDGIVTENGIQFPGKS